MTLGLGLSLPEAAGRGRGSAPVPTTPITTIVIEGDSITSTAPSSPNGFFSYQYAASRPDRTIHVRAQASRWIGTGANLNDDGNTLMGNVAEDAAYGPQLVAAKIGANDFAVGTDAAYRANLIAYRAALRAARPGVKLAWSGPIAYNPTGTPHPQKANFDAQRASLFADARDPAVWGQWADYYLPLGECPDFGDASLAAPLFGDGVHPSTAGQALLFALFRPALDTILDPARAHASSMIGAAWPTSETNLAQGSEIVRRFIVAGVAHTGTALGISVAGSGAQVQVNGGGYGTTRCTGAGNGHRLYNGDVIDLKLTTSGTSNTAVSIDLTIGSETRTLTYTTAADVPATNLVPGGLIDIVQVGSAVHNTSGVSFPATGVGIIAVSGESLPSAVTYKGVAATLSVNRSANSTTAVYTVAIADTAPGTLVVTYAGPRRKTVVYCAVIENADPVPVQSYAPTQDPNTIPTWTIAGITVPAKGIAVGFSEYGGAGAPTGSVATGTQVFEGYGTLENGDRYGMLVGHRATSGALVFGYNTYQVQPMVALAFKALGT